MVTWWTTRSPLTTTKTTGRRRTVVLSFQILVVGRAFRCRQASSRTFLQVKLFHEISVFYYYSCIVNKFFRWLWHMKDSSKDLTFGRMFVSFVPVPSTGDTKEAQWSLWIPKTFLMTRLVSLQPEHLADEMHTLTSSVGVHCIFMIGRCCFCFCVCLFDVPICEVICEPYFWWSTCDDVAQSETRRARDSDCVHKFEIEKTVGHQAIDESCFREHREE